MNILSQASALNPGSDLWIVPEFSKSNWTQKLDWYMNFQMIRSTRHSSAELRNYIVYVQRETGLTPIEPATTTSAPLMIVTEVYLPNKWVVMLPLSKDFDSWVRKVTEIWENLKNPSLRIFLPTGQNASSFEKAWLLQHSFQDFTVVLD